MKIQKQNEVLSAYETPFKDQQELRNNIVDKFVKFGNKVRYQVKLTVKG
jgi:hypothetical protein